MRSPILATSPAESIIVIRLMVGLVFFFEGMQKFLFPDVWGVARFEELGFPAPEFFSYFVGSFEIVCSVSVLSGLYTRLACIPLLVIVVAGFAATKADIFISEGFWGLMHSSRTDFAMILGNVFLFIAGGGKWSVDFYKYTKSPNR